MKILIIIVSVAAGLSSTAAHASQNWERVLIAYMRVIPGTEQRFLKEAKTVIHESRKESGNIRYQLHQSTTNPQQFVFYELFESDQDLQAHRASAHVKAFLKATKPITVQFTLEEYTPMGSIQ